MKNIVYKIIDKNLGLKAKETIKFNGKGTNRLILALDNAYVNKSSISVPYWADELSPEFIEIFTFVCKDILDIEIRNKYASISIDNNIVRKELGTYKDTIDYRRKAKIKKYLPRLDLENRPDNLTKTHSSIKEVGLVRKGFAKSAKVQYSYDTEMLEKYYEFILANTIKSMTKISEKYEYVLTDTSGYTTISKLVLQEIIDNPDKLYNLEYNVSDSRGRSIYNGLKRVFNPIGYKDARSLLKIAPRTITLNDREAIENIYSFISELLGLKRQRYATKILAGMVAYKKRELPKLDLSNEDDRKDLHNLIWLERIYKQLDTLKEKGSVKWVVPVELDATMSLAQVISCLTGEKRLMEKTNIIDSDNLQDAWHIEGVRRDSGKKVSTPQFYGSSATATSLLRKAKISIIPEEVKRIRREFNSGAFAVIKAFKDAMIKTSNVVTPTFQVQGWNENFTIEVNKFKAVSSVLKPYMVWDKRKNRTKTFFMHKPIRVPDYKRFKLFSATCVVHNLDSKIADNVVKSIDSDIIAIHDAFLCHPLDSQQIREVYVYQLDRLYKDREEVLQNFRESLGCVGKKADKAFTKLFNLVEPVKDFKAEISALK